MLKTLTIGKKITIRRKLGQGQSFGSAIQNLRKNVIYITQPYLRATPLTLMHNEPIEVSFVTDSGAYIFDSVYLGAHQETEVLRLYKISMPAEENIKNIQQRNFVRIPLMLDIGYLMLGSKESHRGVAVDLSAGGMKLATNCKLPADKVMELSFEIIDRKQPLMVRVKARIIRSELIYKENNIYHSGLQFLEVSQVLEQKLACFVLQKQIEQLSRG